MFHFGKSVTVSGFLVSHRLILSTSASTNRPIKRLEDALAAIQFQVGVNNS